MLCTANIAPKTFGVHDCEISVSYSEGNPQPFRQKWTHGKANPFANSSIRCIQVCFNLVYLYIYLVA